MATNGEWLDYLAHNAPDELAAWFDAERVTNQAEMLHIDASDGDTAALNARIAELTAERDKLKELNGYHAVQYELASEDCDRLQAQVDELEAKREHQRRELAMFNNLVNTHGLAITDDCWDYRSVRELCDENDELQTRLLRVEADCERYREKFGKCLDYADAIHALMDDEGMA